MPLKKPVSVPKIPKTRKKKVEAARAAIPQKKEDKIEYICIASFFYDENNRKQFIMLRLQTAVLFTSFSYEISVDVRREKKMIDVTIMGLQAKTNFAPKVEPAKADIFLEDLLGEYTVSVIKLDGSINSAVYNFDLLNRKIVLVNKYLPDKPNNRWFCEFDVDAEAFTFAGE